MPTPLPPQELRDMSSGIIQKVDPKIKPANSVYLGLNVFFDDFLGRAVVRFGTTQLGQSLTVGKACLGLWEHVTTAGLYVPLAVFNDVGDAAATLYSYYGGAWHSTKTGLKASVQMRFCTFLDTTAGINGTDAISTVDGQAWSTSGGKLDIGNMPKGKYINEFLDRLQVAGVSANPDRLYLSTIADADAISWTSVAAANPIDNIDIEPEEGTGAITGLSKVPGYTVIHKERSMKRWDGQSTFPESLMTIGALSQEAIVQARQSVIFYNPNRGLFETTGGFPRKISRPIEAIIKAVPTSYYSSISGGSDGDRVYFSIGDITLGDLNLTNCVIAYSIDYKHFALLSFPNEFRMWHSRVGANFNEILFAGDDNGQVWDVLQGVGDGANGNQFDVMVEWQELEFGTRGRIKDVAKFITYTQDIRNASVSVRKNSTGNYKPVGIITKDVVEISHEISARYFDIRIQGKAKSGQIIGLDFPNVSVSDNYNG